MQPVPLGRGVAVVALAALLIPVGVGTPATARPGAGGPASVGTPAQVPAPDDSGEAAGARTAADGVHRVPNPLLKERYANSRRGGPATEPDPPVALCATFLGQP